MERKTHGPLCNCPFCGEKQGRDGEFDGVCVFHDELYKNYWVECLTCGAATPCFKTIEEAVKFWNDKEGKPDN